MRPSALCAALVKAVSLPPLGVVETCARGVTTMPPGPGTTGLVLVVVPAPAGVEGDDEAAPGLEAALDGDAEALADAVALAAGDEPALTGAEDESLEVAVVVEEAQAVAPASSSAPIVPAVSTELILRRPAD